MCKVPSAYNCISAVAATTHGRVLAKGRLFHFLKPGVEVYDRLASVI